MVPGILGYSLEVGGYNCIVIMYPRMILGSLAYPRSHNRICIKSHPCLLLCSNTQDSELGTEDILRYLEHDSRMHDILWVYWTSLYFLILPSLLHSSILLFFILVRQYLVTGRKHALIKKKSMRLISMCAVTVPSTQLFL